jgi:outer membrane protein, heavy metal efflux system
MWRPSLFLPLVLSITTYVPEPALAADSSIPAHSLDKILELALDRNPAVAGAEGFIQERRGQEVASGAYPNPSITGNGGYGEIRDTGRAAIRDDLLRQSLMEYNVTIGQPIEWPAKRAARRRAAEAGLAGASAGLVETRLNLIADVKNAFYELLLAQREAEMARQNLRIVEEVRRIVNARVRLGESPQFEAIKAEVELLKANQAVTRAENVVRVSRVTLDTLTAGALGSTYQIDGAFRHLPAELEIQMLTARALDQHPTVQRLNKLVEQADHSLAFERQARIPNITVNGSYWREIGREAVSAGLSIPTPIWYQRQGEITTAMGTKRREEAQLLRARQGLVKEVTRHFQDAQTTAELLELFEKGLLKQSEEALRIAQFSFRQGAASLLEVLDAQRVQRQVLVDYAQAQFDLSISLTRLEQAVGGTL